QVARRRTPAWRERSNLDTPQRNPNIKMPRRPLRCSVGLLCLATPDSPAIAADAPQRNDWIPATAYAIPKETAPEGEGYFSIIEGHNRRLYIGTHAHGVHAWPAELDAGSGKMRPVVDAQKAIGTQARGFAAQAKIHTRNNVGA